MAERKKRKRNKTKFLKPNVLILAVVSVFIAAMVLSLVVITHSHRRPPQTAYDFGKPVAHGIDVSEHNGKIDWERVSRNFDFAFIRVGYRGYGNGEIHEDKYAKDNLKAAEKAGIPFGVYFYSQAVSDKEAEEEADFVLNIVKHYNLLLPVVIDFEYPTDGEGNAIGRLSESRLGIKENTGIVNSFCDRVENKGYISGLYASSSVLKNNFNINDIDDTVIWAADYNDSVTFDVDYTIWQYSKTGQADGVSSRYVDLNYWYGKR